MPSGFGKRLRETRRQHGWTQDELATAAGVGVATVRRCEGSYFDPRVSTVQRLAGALRVSPWWLLFGQGACDDDDSEPNN